MRKLLDENSYEETFKFKTCLTCNLLGLNFFGNVMENGNVWKSLEMQKICEEMFVNVQ